MPSKKVTAVIGFVPIAMRLDKATESGDDGKHTVCQGGWDGQKAHPAIRVKQSVECPTCGHAASSHWGFPDRAVERGEELVVLSRDEMLDATGEPLKEMHLQFHPREKVYAATLAGGSVNNLRPEKGAEKQYALLRDALRNKPDVVAVTVWAHVSKNQLWVLEVVDERIVASSRCWPEDVRVAPEIAAPAEEIQDAERQMFEQIVDLNVQDFDMATYVDTARHGLRDLVESRQGIPAQKDGSPVAGTALDLVAALQATLEAAKPIPAQKKAPAKKRTTKKAAAKKAVA